ncbi:MAG: hypothetical protein SCK28_06875 [Bacillota bacterium]|nr:hypothetical protein [Bacillota bacterium]
MEKMLFQIDNNKCRGCRRCEMACSWTGSGATNPRMAGIKIKKIEEEGKDYPMLSQTCYDDFCGKEHLKDRGKKIPLCVSTCIFGAITIQRGVEVDE